MELVRRLFVVVLSVMALSLVGCAGAESDAEDDLGSSADEARSRTARFETFVGRDGQHYFYMLAGNGEKLLRSEGYSSRDAALDAIAALRRNATVRANFDLRQAVNGEWYFNVRSTNGATIGTSETYVTRTNATRAISAVIRLVVVANEAQAALTNARFETFRGENGQYYMRLRAANGEIVLTSEGYASTSGATNVIESLRRYGTTAANFEVRSAGTDRFWFVAIAPNNEIIGTSEMYVSSYNATRGRDSVIAILRANPALASQ